MICEYCGKEFEGRKRKYCSKECCRSADRDNKRIKYVWKSARAPKCLLCGGELSHGQKKYCSQVCRRRYQSIYIEKRSFDHGELTKICPVCGKEFKTWKSRQLCCSIECSEYKNAHREYNPEKEHERYVEKHPGAMTAEEYRAQRQTAKAERLALMEPEIERRKQERLKREAERVKRKAAQEEQKKYWREYEEEHECCECGKKFKTHYPTAKYCSKRCKRRASKVNDRYEGITIDKNITLRRLAKRDRNQCQICGLFVDWNDYMKSDKTVICGDMYPSIDHITPISLGGLHSWNNVQLAHRCCNIRKSNKYIG